MRKKYTLELLWSNGVLTEIKISKHEADKIMELGTEFIKSKYSLDGSKAEVISFQIFDENERMVISPTGEEGDIDDSVFEEMDPTVIKALKDLDFSDFDRQLIEDVQERVKRAHDFLSNMYDNTPSLVFHENQGERDRYDLEKNEIHLSYLTLCSEAKYGVYHDYRTVLIRLFDGAIKRYGGELFLVLDSEDSYLAGVFVYAHEFAHFLNDRVMKTGRPFKEHDGNFIHAFRQVLNELNLIFPKIEKYAILDTE